MIIYDNKNLAALVIISFLSTSTFARSGVYYYDEDFQVECVSNAKKLLLKNKNQEVVESLKQCTDDYLTEKDLVLGQAYARLDKDIMSRAHLDRFIERAKAERPYLVKSMKVALAKAYIVRASLNIEAKKFSEAVSDYEEAILFDSSKSESLKDVLKYARSRLPADKTTNNKSENLVVSKKTTINIPAIDNKMIVNNERRVALIIGNAGYIHTPILSNPIRDARAVEIALKGAGFTVVQLQLDQKIGEFHQSLAKFASIADGADWAVIYYAGHGLEVAGNNYLVPVDAQLERSRDVDFQAIPLTEVLNSISGATKVRVVILDACRNNPLADRMIKTAASRAVSISSGVKPIQPNDTGMLIAYSAKHGETALDGDELSNSPYASAFVQNVAKPRIDIRIMFGMIRDQVVKNTDRMQEPFIYGSLGGDEYYINSKPVSER